MPHAWNMAAGEHGSTPRHCKPTLLLFLGFCRLCLDLIWLSNNFFADLFGRLCSWTCAFDFSLLRCAACASVLYALQSLSARARFADPVRILLRHCLPCSCLHHAVLLVIALFTSRHCAHTVQLHPHSVFISASFLIDNLVGFLVTLE